MFNDINQKNQVIGAIRFLAIIFQIKQSLSFDRLLQSHTPEERFHTR